VSCLVANEDFTFLSLSVMGIGMRIVVCGMDGDGDVCCGNGVGTPREQNQRR